MGLLGKLFGQSAASQEDRTEAILQKHLDGDFTVFPMAEGRSTTAQLQAIGQRHGVSYPPEFVAHVTGTFPGIYIEVKEAVWPRPKPYDVGPFWSFLYALHTFTPAPESDAWMRLDAAAESFQKNTGLKAAPVLQIKGDADLYCVDSAGRLVQFRHEETKLELVSLDFWQLFERELAVLFDRKKKKKGGTAP